MYTNLNKNQVENCPHLPEWNLISLRNGMVKSVSAGRVEILSQQTGFI